MSPVNAAYPVEILLPDRWWYPVIYRLKTALTIAGVNVPLHFETDGATTPRWTWIFFPPVCRYFPAAVVHDYLLTTGVSWRVANRVFRQVLRELNVSWWRRGLMATSVGIYGFYRTSFHGDN